MQNTDTLVIKQGRIIDPSQQIDRVSDLIIDRGVIGKIDDDIAPPAGARLLDANGLVVSPGFIDLHCHLREPGFEHKETVATATLAAARGGFTTVCAMPNTNPVMDSRAVVEFLIAKASEEGVVNVLPIGAITKGSKGKELAEMGELAEAGVIAYSDDGNPVMSSNIMRQALSYSSTLGLPIINHCEVPELTAGASMNEGWVANRLGIKGSPSSAEDVMVARDISLSKLTGGRLHIAHASTAGAIELVRQAKTNGTNVTCEVTPHHLTLSDEAVLGQGTPSAFSPLTEGAYDTNAKVNPPLRSRADLDAVVEGLRDGTVDFVATDHAPHGLVDKICTFDEAAHGISVLETALGSLMSLVHAGRISLPQLIQKLTSSPAGFLRRELGALKVGFPADVTVIDPDAEWVVNSSLFASKGKNTPLDGVLLKGKVTATIVAGRIVYGG